MKKLKAGIVGLGQQALDDHLQGFLNCQHAELSAICEVDKKKFSNVKDDNIDFYYDFNDFINDTNLDFVILSTPHYLHKEMLIKLIDKNCHVLKEKPLAISLADALLLKRLAKEKQIINGGWINEAIKEEG